MEDTYAITGQSMFRWGTRRPITPSQQTTQSIVSASSRPSPLASNNHLYKQRIKAMTASHSLYLFVFVFVTSQRSFVFVQPPVVTSASKPHPLLQRCCSVPTPRWYAIPLAVSARQSVLRVDTTPRVISRGTPLRSPHSRSL